MERHTKKDHGLTEIGNVVENSVGMAIFTTEALVKETVIETRPEKLPHQCDQCEYKSLRKLNLKRHMIKHDGIAKPELRGRKRKTGPLSERTKSRRKAENRNNLTGREVSWMMEHLSSYNLR